MLIVEDIIDTGHTLSKREDQVTPSPSPWLSGTLLDTSRRGAEVAEWVVYSRSGCVRGIDCAQLYRNLRYVGKVVLLEE